MRTYALLLWIVLVAGPTFPAVAQGKIATIDLQKVFNEYYKTKVADLALKDQAAELDKEKQTLLDEYQTALDSYKQALEDANNQAISAEERDRRKKAAEGRLLALKEQEGSITQFDRQARSTLDERTRRMRENILEEIRAAVIALAKQQSYSLVIDSTAETPIRTPILLYSSGENDITDVILAQLNASAPPDSLKLPAPQ